MKSSTLAFAQDTRLFRWSGAWMNLVCALSVPALIGSILWLDGVLPCNTWGCLIRMAALLFGPIGLISALAELSLWIDSRISGAL